MGLELRPVSTRRRYDTTALVGRMRQERRRNLMLGMCAAGTLTALTTFYMLNMRGMTIPEVPADAKPHAPVGGVAAPAVGGAPSMGQAQPAAPTPAPAPVAETAPAPAKPKVIEEKPPSTWAVRPNMPSGALVWIDDAGVQRGSQLQLAEGRHALRVKIGKHTLHERFEVKAGESLELRLDAKKKKLVIERHQVAKSR